MIDKFYLLGEEDDWDRRLTLASLERMYGGLDKVILSGSISENVIDNKRHDVMMHIDTEIPFYMTNKDVAQFLSHRNCWKQIRDSPEFAKDKIYMIIEKGVIFSNDFKDHVENLGNVLQGVSTNGILLMGHDQIVLNNPVVSFVHNFASKFLNKIDISNTVETCWQEPDIILNNFCYVGTGEAILGLISIAGEIKYPLNIHLTMMKKDVRCFKHNDASITLCKRWKRPIKLASSLPPSDFPRFLSYIYHKLMKKNVDDNIQVYTKPFTRLPGLPLNLLLIIMFIITTIFAFSEIPYVHLKRLYLLIFCLDVMEGNAIDVIKTMFYTKAIYKTVSVIL